MTRDTQSGAVGASSPLAGQDPTAEGPRPSDRRCRAVSAVETVCEKRAGVPARHKGKRPTHRFVHVPGTERNYICLDCGEPGFDITDAEQRMPRWLRRNA